LLEEVRGELEEAEYLDLKINLKNP